MEANALFQMQSIPRKVYHPATTALVAGYAVAYDPTNTNIAAVTVEDKARGKYVVAPTAAIDLFFAGVLKSAKATTKGKNFVEVDKPGSDTLIYMTEAVTAGQIAYFNAGGDNAGQWSLGGIGTGRGAAVVHTTLTEAGYAHATLLEGDNAGGVQLITPVAAGGAQTGISLNGMTLIDGTNVVTANVTYTLADGTFIGQRKAFNVTTTIGTSKNFVVTVTTGVQLDGSTALATLTFNTAAEQSILEWTGVHWKLIANSGATIA